MLGRWIFCFSRCGHFVTGGVPERRAMSGNFKSVELHIVRAPKGTVLDAFWWPPMRGWDVAPPASLSSCHVWKCQARGTSRR